MRVLPLGVLTLLLVVGLAFPAAAKQTHEIRVTASEFTPENLTILTGDVVKWVWVSGDHVIQNGESPTSEDAGAIFEFHLNGSAESVEITFAKAGEFPFFSAAYYESMSGIITVQEATPVNRATWGWLKRTFEDEPSSSIRRYRR